VTDHPHIEMFTRVRCRGPGLLRTAAGRPRSITPGDRRGTDQFGELVASRALAERRPPAGAEFGARPPRPKGHGAAEEQQPKPRLSSSATRLSTPVSPAPREPEFWVPQPNRLGSERFPLRVVRADAL
jgi:hypothetical protein